MVLGRPFLTLINIDVLFLERELTFRFYIAAEALPTTKRVEIIDKKEFAKTVLDENVEAFVVHVTSLSRNLMSIYPAQETQIASLLAKKVKIPTKYSDFSDIFSEEKASILPKATDLNQPCERLHLAFKVTRWCFYSLCREARRQPPPMCRLLGSQ